MNAKVSMDVCISPNIAFVFSGFASLKLTPVERDKIQKNVSQNKNDITNQFTYIQSFNKSIYTPMPVVWLGDKIITTNIVNTCMIDQINDM